MYAQTSIRQARPGQAMTLSGEGVAHFVFRG